MALNDITDMRLDGQRGKLYELEFKKEKKDSGTLSPGWYRVTGRASSGSTLPVQVGRVFKVDAATTKSMVAGDAVMPFDIVPLCFALDTSVSVSVEKTDATTQCDTVKTYITSGISEMTGSVNGYYVDGSDAQKRLLGRFTTIITNDGTTITETEQKTTGTFHTLLSRKEKASSISGHELWDYIPMVVDSITLDKPSNGMQVFNFNFTAVGGEQPHHYRHKII